MKELIDQPIETMKKHGKSFYFASQIFPKWQLNNIAILYAFCRYVDDCADELEPSISTQKLTQLKNFLEQNHFDFEGGSLVQQLNLKGVRSEFLLELLDGALFDVHGGQIKSKKDLLVYCYKVAGVVGLMMCPLLGVKEVIAQRYAIDLGIGMQLTNISRDILEDATNDRCYVPANILHAANLNPDNFKSKGSTPADLKDIVKFLLDTADQYYNSSKQGFSFIPLRARIAILVASEVYREIGNKIRKNKYEVLNGRTFLSLPEKIFCTFKALRFLFTKNFWVSSEHLSALHIELRELPQTNPGNAL